MKRRVVIASVIAAFAFLSNCATVQTEAKKSEPATLSVRLPVADAASLNITSEPFPGFPELPLSVADESRGRWLRLFELNYSPAKPPARPHTIIGGGPSR